MAGLLLLLNIFLGFYCYQEVTAQMIANFMIKRFDVCETDNSIIFNGNITTEHKKQYLEFNITLPMPLDDHVGFHCFIESAVHGKIFLPLFTIREKNFCLAANKYLGELWYDIERAGQIIPVGGCPIRAGRYHVHHFYLNFEKMSLQTFPFGRLRVTLTAVDKRKAKALLCFKTEAENFKL